MADKELFELETTSAGNITIPQADGGFPELMDRSAVNDSSRKLQAAIRRWYDDPEWLNLTVRGPDPTDVAAFVRASATQFSLNLTGVDFREWFTVGRMLLITDGGGVGVDLLTQVESNGYNGSDTTTINITSTDSMNAAASAARVHHSATVRRAAFEDSASPLFVPATMNSAGINAAIQAADAAGHGIVLLTGSTYSLEAQIDLNTYGGVRLMGSGPETILRQDAAAGITPLIVLGNSSKGATLENLQVDMNGNAGIAVEIDGHLRPRFESVTVNGGTVSVQMTATQLTNVIFDRCFFTNFTSYAIASTGPSNIHEGQIQSCRFTPTASPGIADPACVKVAGSWLIDGNIFTGVGDATSNYRGIWIWNEVTQDGGRQSVVSNNGLSATSTSGTMIEIGADEVICNGNRMELNGANQKGIWVNGPTVGQTITYVNVTGNICTGGNPITISERTLGCVIEANNCVPAAGETGIEVAGDSCVISGNFIQSGAIGIDITSTASQVAVEGNSCHGQSTAGIRSTGAVSGSISRNKVHGAPNHAIDIAGAPTNQSVIGNLLYSTSSGIRLGADVDDAIVRGNTIPSSSLAIEVVSGATENVIERNDTRGSSTHLTDAGTNTNRVGNSAQAQTVAYTTASNGLSLPCGGGGGRFLAHIVCQSQDNTGGSGTVTINLHSGALGTTGDPVVATVQARQFAGVPDSASSFTEFTAAAGATVSIAQSATGGSTFSSHRVTIFKIGTA